MRESGVSGVVCHQAWCGLQEQVSSWALGSQQHEFVTAAVFSSSSNSYYAVTQQAGVTSTATQTLLAWPATTASGSLEQLAQRHLLAGNVHSLHPAPSEAGPSGDTDCSTAVAIVYSDGAVALGAQDTKAQARPAGCRVVSATADGDTLAVVCTVKGSANPLLELHSLQVCSVNPYVTSCA